MTDILTGLSIMAALTAVVLLLTIRFTRPLTRREATGVGTVVALLMILYLRFAWQTALLSQVLPWSNVVVLSNWFPLAAAFLAGVTWTHGYGTKLRRVLFGLAVLGISGWSMIQPLLGQPPECEDFWDGNGVCRSTSKYTCSPASAATLLRRYGIKTSEAEMARLCLTRRGTTWQGIYRGLRLKLDEQPLDQKLPRRIDVIECDWKELRTRLSEPAILSVGLLPGTPGSDVYISRWGWQPGVLHSVVLMEFHGDDLMLIADPAVGLEFWSMTDLQNLYRGRAIRLAWE